MATIRTAIQVTDGMTPAFKSMNKAMNIVLSSFEAIQNVSNKAIDTSSIQAARTELNKAEIAFNNIEQEIREASEAQEKFNNRIRSGQGATDSLLGKIKGMATTLGAAIGIKNIAEISDEMVSTTARLNLMNDGLQTTKQLQDMIFQSAQRSRSSYLDTAQVVSKLGILAKDAFGSNKEMVYFAELMNKQFKIGGASIQEQTAAMYQLTQAMAAGRLQGDEFRSIMENAPMLAQAIAKHMGKTTGELREMSSQGLITADIIKNAMFATAEETNERFSRLPMTWGQVWTSVINRVLIYSQPLLDFINLLANNWTILEPIILGVAGAVAVYMVAAYGAAAAAKVWTAAQAAFNAVMALNPVAIVIIALVALIALFYTAVAAVNKFAGTSISATGIVVGAFYVAIAFVGNLFVGLVNLTIDILAIICNYIINFAEFFANVFNDPIGSVVRLFAGGADTILSILESIASAIDTIFGSNLANTVSGWRSGLQGKVDDLVGEAKIKIDRIDPNSIHLQRANYSTAWDMGYNAGENFNLLGGAEQYLANIADNTANMADSMSASEEDLKYMRELAEQEVINRFTTAEIKIEMTNDLNVSKEMDIDGIVSKLEEKVYETMIIAAEGGMV